MTMANKITLLRILLIPVFIITYIKNIAFLPAIILALSVLTDFLDGTIARKFKQHTKLGALLDPTADKLFIFAVMLTLTLSGKMPLWVFIIIFSKDLLVSLAWFLNFVISNSTDVTPRMLGKISSAAQMILSLLIVLNIPSSIVSPAIMLTVAITILAGFDYIIVGSKTLV